MARPIILIPHLFQLANAINFRKDYSSPSSLPSRPYTAAAGAAVKQKRTGMVGRQDGAVPDLQRQAPNCGTYRPNIWQCGLRWRVRLVEP